MLEASGADLRLSTDYREVLPHLNYRHLICTGPVDEYFASRAGALPYRTLRFQLEEISAAQNPSGYAQPVLRLITPGPKRLLARWN